MKSDRHQVLDVGNCGFDHAALQGLIEREFNARVVQADGLDDSLHLLREGTWQLVLVNRQFDHGGDGLELIRQLKSDPELAEIPVLLLSNYPEYQQQAQQLGAAPGFGKAALKEPETRRILAQYLG